MINRNPYDRDDLKISKKDRVLEVGLGHNPTLRTDVIVERFLESNFHRCGNVKLYPHQEIINANGEALPFKDKKFDYVICNQVLEHVENPADFIREQCRVAKRGVYGDSQPARRISFSEKIAQVDYPLSGQ